LDRDARSLEKDIQAAAESRKKLPINVSSVIEESKVATEEAAKTKDLCTEKQARAQQRKEKITTSKEAFRKNLISNWYNRH
jgi:hypothetical protein